MYNGRISLLASSWGPILSPFWCEIPIIEQLIESKYRVYEVLPNGDRVLLTKQNYDQDNGGGTPPGPPIPPVTPPSENDNTTSNHLKEKIETDKGIHGTLRYKNGRFEKYNASTETWVVAYAEDKLEIADTVVETNVGGLKAGTDLEGLTMDEIVDKIIHVTTPPTIVLSLTPASSVNEKGVIIPSVTLSAEVTQGESTISSIKFMKDGVVINTPVVAGVPVQTYIYNYIGDVSVDTEFKVEVIDADNTIQEVRQYMFILPKFKGKLSALAPLDSTAIAALDKFIQQSPTVSLNITTVNEKVAIAVPSALTLVSVVDQNNYIVTGLFETINVTHTLLDSTVENYKLIVSIDPMTVENFGLVFNLS
jgi:hypothetical protein